MPPAAEEKYRRLPGRRRGIVSGASLWMGSDHILLVKSAWFREEYKRFYLRDIQAIVVAPGVRFYVSAPMLAFAVAWLFSASFLTFWPQAVAIGWTIATVVWIGAWLAVSLAGGCRCRLYTAVSRDELPSLFRTWTARRFLRQVEPRIEELQGRVDANWTEAGKSSAGPVAAASAPAEVRPRTRAANHTPASDLFVLVLVVSSIVGLATARSISAIWNRVNTGLAVVLIVGAVAVLVEHSRGKLSSAMQRVAVASMLLTGVTFYVQTFTFTFINSVRAGAGPAMTGPLRPFVVAHQATYWLELLLGFIGAILTLSGTYRNETDIIKD
ncbi:MAG TPA: hypothetical protein VMB03_16510 [Bryobacteraceae bacterium]|nr:hypothetical protein [Bryobacteraceae bacterium]